MVGDGQVPAGFVQKNPLLRCRLRSFPQPDDVDFGSHHRPVNEVEPQHVEPAIVTGAFEIAVEQSSCEMLLAVFFEVHDEERDFADHVNPAESGFEFDAVKQARSSVNFDDVFADADRRGIRG